MCNYHSINLNVPIHNITANRTVMQTRIIRVPKSWKPQFNKNFKNKNNNILTSEAVLRPKVTLKLWGTLQDYEPILTTWVYLMWK